MSEVTIDINEATRCPYILEQFVDFEVEGKTGILAFGDYHFHAPEGKPSVLVERKSLKDFLASIKDGRLFKQAAGLVTFMEEGRPIILIEGILNRKTLRRWNTWSVLGALNSLAIDFGITCMNTSSKYWSARMLVSIAFSLRSETEGEEKKVKSLRLQKKPKTIDEKALFLLQGLPGVSSTRALNLLAYFGSPRAVFNATPDELISCPKVGDVTMLDITEVLDFEFGDGDEENGS